MATRGRPRRAEADAEILEAALAMLRVGGYRELSLDEVARRAGTAKSSIYRRWPSKAALAAEVVRRDVPAPEGDLAVAFEALMNGALGGVVASLIGEAQESAETRSIVLDLLAPYRGAGDDALGRILFRSLLSN
ncbi:MAG TPA: helix-turn-helix domain-containing protein [Thermoanaerobaculia bacterium]|jgi:AcrR family transcriptional regulator|nr:helix-turn-helix domain-containing protein [Thermoanaerobaculia bacterium]